MRILDALFGVHADRMQESLGKTAARHRLLAGNLANINTPGYKRRDSDFAISLKEAQASTRMKLRPVGGGGGESGVDERSVRIDGNSVDLETEVAALSETQLHFNAVSLMSRRFFQGLKDVIREGRQ